MYILTAYENDEPIGMGRIVGDGAVICYVQDLIVIPEKQSDGIGGMILNRLKKFVAQEGIPGTTMMFDLMCAKGRENFYEKQSVEKIYYSCISTFNCDYGVCYNKPYYKLNHKQPQNAAVRRCSATAGRC